MKTFSHFWFKCNENNYHFKEFFIYATYKKTKRFYVKQFNPIQDGPFQYCSWLKEEVGQKGSCFQISDTQ